MGPKKTKKTKYRTNRDRSRGKEPNEVRHATVGWPAGLKLAIGLNAIRQ